MDGDMLDESDYEDMYKRLHLANFTLNDLNTSDIDSQIREYMELDENRVISTIIYHMDVYLVPLLVLVGLTGNLVSFVVFTATYMRRLSSSVYLAALSFVDMVFLICVFVSWARHINVDLYQRDGWCQTFLYLVYVTSFLSVWFVVSFTVERYIAVYYPLRRYDFCTPARAKLVVMSLAIFAALLYSFGTWTSGVNKYGDKRVCHIIPQYNSFVNIVNNVDTVITLILPFMAILVMNLRIAYKVVQFYRARREMGNTGTSPMHSSMTSASRTFRHRSYSTGLRITVASSGANGVNQRNGYFRNQVRVTKMLLTVSTMFLVLNLPRHTARTYTFIRGLSGHSLPSHGLIMSQKVFHFLYYIHFCVNVFLYSALGSNFRKALVSLLKRIKRSLADLFYTLAYACCGMAKTRTEIHGGTAMMARLSPSPGATSQKHLLVRELRAGQRNMDYL